jgi:hypothetical protein
MGCRLPIGAAVDHQRRRHRPHPQLLRFQPVAARARQLRRQYTVYRLREVRVAADHHHTHFVHS